jgi:hypothetical protein
MSIADLKANQAQYARCRTAWQGHDWDDAPPDPNAFPHKPARWLMVGFRCARCGMRKHYLFNPTNGETSKPRYTHKPMDYHSPGVTRADWKVLFVTQYVAKGAAAEVAS